MAPIGVPAVTFTNWPDDYIHSSDDDLWQIDPTQLERNAVAVAASAWFIATAGRAELPVLAGQMVGRALERIGHDTRRVIEMVQAAPAGDSAARERAAGIVRESVAREQRAIRTMAVLSRETGPTMVETALAQLPSVAEVGGRVRALTGPIAAASPSAAELDAEARVPSFVDNLAAFLARRKQLERPPALHGLMAYEILNFVDGTRTIADVYRAVAAEADLAGDWYYGQVALKDVVAYIDSAAKAGIVTVRSSAPLGKKPVTSRKGR